jgi:dolichol-phosphate mannosyltransferase
MLSLIIPTYNERGNIRPLWEGLCRHLEDFEAIFVDDNSPDGTAREIEDLQDPRARLLSRPGKLGLGSAVVAGLGLCQGEYVGMMDADLSHRPEDVGRLYQAAKEADITVGSRYVPGGKITGWPLRRKVISRGATLMARLILWMRVKDPLSGLAIYRREVLEELRGRLSARGYKLLLEVLARDRKSRVQEVPITFVERTHGQSKLDRGEFTAFLHLLWELRRRA